MVKVVTVGIGGPSCSGKTTATRILRQILTHSVVVYQDDFYKPEEEVPLHPETQYGNWDCPESVDFDRFAAMIEHVCSHQGCLPKGYDSNEENNTHDGSSLVSEATLASIRNLLAPFIEDYVFVFVDGFMLYYDDKVANQLDLKFQFTSSYEILKARRDKRQGYHTMEGYWVDPPGYFDKVVWPEHLRLSAYYQQAIEGLHQMDTAQLSIDQTVLKVAQIIQDRLS
ncbi:P-loop containing nucleoside triphosphate hydrolase protein [Blakeslea trispora]|nr:P-loop containing nucleoside triphosphate hydrolase protein [Blakeslea trispora]